MTIEMRAVDHPSVWRGPGIGRRGDWIVRVQLWFHDTVSPAILLYRVVVDDADVPLKATPPLHP